MVNVKIKSDCFFRIKNNESSDINSRRGEYGRRNVLAR